MVNRRKVRSSTEAATSGTFTRSKSDLFLHRTRSGRSRPDPNRRHHQSKDLRLKRVFSRIDDKRSESEDPEISKRSSDDESGETTPPDLNVVSRFDAGKGIRVSEETNVGNLSESNLGLSSCSQSKVFGNPSSNSYRRLLPYLKDLAKDGSSGIQILQSRNLLPKTEKVVLPHIQVGCESDGVKGSRVSGERNLGNSSENKQVPDQFSRSKMIMNRSSINYKRLLPYLKDLDKDDSSDKKIFQSNNLWPKVEKTTNETTLVLNPPHKQQDTVSPLCDSPMVDSDFAENPVQEKPILNSDEEIVQNPSRVESPIHEATTKIWFNDEHMDALNGQDQEKGVDKERCIYDAENSKVSVESSEDMAQSTPPDVDLTRKLEDVENGSRGTILNSETNNAPKENMGLVLCSRSKLYRNPSSFSYRRLLPYLTDLAKNHPNGLEIIQSHNNTAKGDNIIEENQDLEGTHVSESPILDSQGDINDLKVTKLPNLCNENKVQVLGSTDEISPKRLDFEFEMVCSEDLSIEEHAGDTMKEIEGKHDKKVSRALAPRKSILKKHTIGCKGICTCLDCTLFRIHAERAYEFSRRQLSSADEVVERLMKELSCLRNVMEKSQVNQEQVKIVCQRALGVEEQAKNHMRHMFSDLNAHCKIPGPRVTFPDAVNERIIP